MLLVLAREAMSEPFATPRLAGADAHPAKNSIAALTARTVVSVLFLII
jgi:hypothetical protein